MNGDRELPLRPKLEEYETEAEQAVTSHASGDPAVIGRIRQARPGSGDVLAVDSQNVKLSLADAQLVIAWEHGFESWPIFTEHIASLTAQDCLTSRFELAADAVISGDVDSLVRSLRASPELARERSTRRHRATLLNYVGANGVEQYRQETPQNAVQVAGILLEAGADVNAVGEMYGGTTTLGLVATSIHPWRAGLQEPLMEILLHHGAGLEVAVAQSYRGVVNACLANGRGEAAAYLANRGARLDLEGAAGVGRLDVVQSFFLDRGILSSQATVEQRNKGFAWACQFGRTSVVDFLLQTETGLQANLSPGGQTGLHWAAYGGHADIVRLLLERGAPVDIREDRYDGTPLGWALYGWGAGPYAASRGSYYEAVALLVRAGARVDPEWYVDSEDRQHARHKVQSDVHMLAALRGEF